MGRVLCGDERSAVITQLLSYTFMYSKTLDFAKKVSRLGYSSTLTNTAGYEIKHPFLPPLPSPWNLPSEAENSGYLFSEPLII
jgi:hypothetical protein